MKKKILLFIILIICITTLGNIINTIEKKISNPKTKTKAVSCYPGKINVLAPSIPFKHKENKIALRKDIAKLSTSEIDSLRVAFARMRANRNARDPRSWIYQAAIHGPVQNANFLEKGLPGLPGSAVYAHSYSGTTYQFFLVWHRMYLYFFEQTLVSYQGNTDLRLPYWNPANNNGMLPAFCTGEMYDSVYYIKNRDRGATIKKIKRVGNPLYNYNRVNTSLWYEPLNICGGSCEYHIYYRQINESLKKDSYCGFLEKIAASVHNNIHGIIGGEMSDLSKAAIDPLFFFHHANIDRLWETWLTNKEHQNPTMGDFFTQPFYFQSELNGSFIAINGGDITDTRKSLRYFYPYTIPHIRTYENVNDCCAVSNGLGEKLMSLKGTSAILGDKTTITFGDFKISNLFALWQTLLQETDIKRLTLELENVQVNELPDGTMDVYIVKNDEGGETPLLEYYAESLNLINTTISHGLGERPNIQVDITQAFLDLRKKFNRFEDFKSTRLVFRTSRNQNEVVPNIGFEAMNLYVEK